MTLFEKTRIKIGNALLYNQTKGSNRQVKAINLNNAKSVGIIFDAGNPANQKLVNQFMKDYPSAGVEFSVIGYIPDPKANHNYISDKTWHYFSLKDCNFLMMPDNDSLTKFTRKKHDLLLILDTRFHFPVKCLARKSLATFKAGVSNIYDELDFMIEVKGDSIEPLIENLKHYLGQLRTPDMQNA